MGAMGFGLEERTVRRRVPRPPTRSKAGVDSMLISLECAKLLSAFHRVEPVVEHGSQGLFEGVQGPPTRVAPDLVRAAKDDLFVGRAHQAGDWPDFRFDARQL